MLTDAKARNSKPALKAFKLVDGQGLHLLVHPNGGKYWQLRYRFTNRERTASLGTYPEVSLSEARTQRDEIRKSIKQGIDPVAQKRAERLSLAEAQEKTFEKVANQ